METTCEDHVQGRVQSAFMNEMKPSLRSTLRPGIVHKMRDAS